MKLSAILAPMLAANVPSDVILSTVRAWEGEQEAALQKSREKAQARWAKWREGDKGQAARGERKRLQTFAGVGNNSRAEGNLLTNNQDGQIEKGKEDAPAAPPSPKRGAPTRISEDFQPDIQVALNHGFTASEARQMASDFRDWFLQTPGSKGLKADWPATWRTWCSRAARDRVDRKPAPHGGAPPPRAPTMGDAAREKRLELEARQDEYFHPGHRRLEASNGSGEAGGPGMSRRFTPKNAFLG